MSKRPSCAECRAYNAFTHECRRHAPQPLAVPSAKPGELRVVGMFPGVTDSHWCLEFEPEAEIAVVKAA